MKGWYQLRFTEDANKTRQDCVSCGRSMWLPKSKLHWHLTCSRECSAKRRAAERELRRRECETCGATFYPRPGQLKLGAGRFCRQACNVAARAALNTPESQAKAKASWRAKLAAGEIIRQSGESNHRWKGGPAASRERRRVSGKAAAALRAYRAKNPDKVREFTRRRADRKMGSLPRGTVKRLGEAQGWRCAICASSVKRRYHLDHIMPLARGGEHAPRNLQLLCAPCNLRKSDRDPIEHMQSLGMLL